MLCSADQKVNAAGEVKEGNVEGEEVGGAGGMEVLAQLNRFDSETLILRFHSAASFKFNAVPAITSEFGMPNWEWFEPSWGSHQRAQCNCNF